MVQIGYHASHEQFSPQALLHYAQVAAEAGFTSVMASDHLNPWSQRQGQSGFVWSWLGAAMQATSLSFGMVNAPGQRYHPVIIAQATATLASMFPDRLWCAFGTGQLMNEYVTGQRWPSKAERNARLLECVTIIRALWAGETITHHGTAITVDEAHLYTRPINPPLLLGAAITPETAAWVASWADGIITVYKPLEQQRAFIDAFRSAGGEGKPMFLQAQTSYAPNDDAAFAGAYDQWRNAALPSTISTEIRNPTQFDQLVELVSPASLREHIRISADLGQHREWLQQDIALGFDRIYLHNVNREQLPFLHAFGEYVLPAIQSQEVMQ